MCCAIYTRKSSEEGLEQDFNSLDAQREACEAFILSQKHAGWTALAAMYDDGGVSGATLARPALQRLLDDVRAGRVDVVVVYKVDRLTRSLADFAKIVETFDAHGVSFVSVTQQFNTTTSMGRLTLNVLLSFAQFEREVTGERIRDKIAASKQKGMWMGGLPPLGYNVQGKKLVVNAAEAETVRHIYRHYAALGSVRLLQRELGPAGIVSKIRQNHDGRHWGGNKLARGALYRMLQNRIYLGEIVHKGRSYPGDHAAIIDQELWDAVQTRLAQNAVNRTLARDVHQPSLLAGLIHDEHGNRMTPTHAVKSGKRYRYYVSQTLIIAGKGAAPRGRRLPAGDIEQLISDRLRGFLASGAEVHGAIERRVAEASDQRRLITRAGELAVGWSDLTSAERRAWLRALITRIDVSLDRIDIHIDPARLARLLAQDRLDPSVLPKLADGEEERLTLSVRARLRRAGQGTRMIVDGARAGGPDIGLIKLLIKADRLRDKLFNGDGSSIAELARRDSISDSSVTRHLRLTFLAPDIVQAILDGRHPPTLTAAQLIKDTRLPLAWQDQRTALGFA
jgi:DNA invertase Pin-like site-specific DNA recombinase